MKLKKLLAAVTTGVLAVTSLSLSGLVSSAEVQELMNDTFESGYGAWKGVGSSLSLSTEQSHSGGTSLYCYDRTASWGAPRCSLTGSWLPVRAMRSLPAPCTRAAVSRTWRSR